MVMGFTGGVKVFIEYLRKSWGSGCCPVGCTAIPRHLHDKTYRKHCLNIEKSGYCRVTGAGQPHKRGGGVLGHPRPC